MLTEDEWRRITGALVAKHWQNRAAYGPGDEGLRAWFEGAIGTTVADVMLILDGTLTIEHFES